MRLAILDKDGTLVCPESGSEFVQHPQDQKLLPGVKEAIAHLISNGYTLAIASNQGGVATGHKTLEDAIAEMWFCRKLLSVKVPTMFFCPDLKGEECYFLDGQDVYPLHSVDINLTFDAKFRKPDPGMLLAAQAMQQHPIESVLMIGNPPEDEGAANAAGIRFLHADQWRMGAL